MPYITVLILISYIYDTLCVANMKSKKINLCCAKLIIATTLTIKKDDKTDHIRKFVD